MTPDNNNSSSSSSITKKEISSSDNNNNNDKSNEDAAGAVDDEIDLTPIKTPHNHDVLCGRGGLSNQHSGNEWFRRLVRANRPLYRKCAKHTKLLVAKAVVHAVQNQDPPGRFLEATDKHSGTWRQVRYKKAIDKTSQALREKGTPADEAAMVEQTTTTTVRGMEAFVSASAATAGLGVRAAALAAQTNNLKELSSAALKSAGMTDADGKVGASAIAAAQQQQKKGSTSNYTTKKRKGGAAGGAATFVKPSWWSRGTPLVTGTMTGAKNSNNNNNNNKRTGVAASTTADAATTLVGMASQTVTPGGGTKFSCGSNNLVSNAWQQASKRMKVDASDDMPLPPTAGLQSRQSSMFRFLSSSGIFGSAAAAEPGQVATNQQHQNRQGSALGAQGGMYSFSKGQSQANTAELMGRIHLQQQQQLQGRQMAASSTEKKPAAILSSTLPYNRPEDDNTMLAGQNTDAHTDRSRKNLETAATAAAAAAAAAAAVVAPPPPPAHLLQESNSIGASASQKECPQGGLFPDGTEHDDVAMAVPPPSQGLTSQMSDWLTSFFPNGQGTPVSAGAANDDDDDCPVPPPPGGGASLSRSVSSAIFSLVESPSQILTTLKSGITSMFGNDPSSMEPLTAVDGGGVRGDCGIAPIAGSPVWGQATTSKRESLIDDDDDEAPVVTKLRSMES